jgi:hypothetical protein
VPRKAREGVQWYTALCRQHSSFDGRNAVWGSPGNGLPEKCVTATEQAVETPGGGRWRSSSWCSTPPLGVEPERRRDQRRTRRQAGGSENRVPASASGTASSAGAPVRPPVPGHGRTATATATASRPRPLAHGPNATLSTGIPGLSDRHGASGSASGERRANSIARESRHPETVPVPEPVAVTVADLLGGVWPQAGTLILWHSHPIPYNPLHEHCPAPDRTGLGLGSPRRV